MCKKISQRAILSIYYNGSVLTKEYDRSILISEKFSNFVYKN